MGYFLQNLICFDYFKVILMKLKNLIDFLVIYMINVLVELLYLKVIFLFVRN